jgi:hypothetical protein
MWGALSDERTGLSFTIASGPRQRFFESESRGTRNHMLLFQIRDFPFRRLLRLAGLRRRHSNPAPHGIRSELNSVLLLHSVSVSKEMFVDYSCPGKSVPYRAGFLVSISTETCLSTRFLTICLHVTIYTYQVEDWYRLSSNIKVLPQKFERLQCWYC